MSVQFDWDRLLQDEAQLSEKIRQFLDDQFQKLPLPSYISSLSVTSFSLGTVAPEVTIKHITDPFPEFYEDEDEDEDEGQPPPPPPPMSPASESSLPSYTTEDEDSGTPAPAGLHYFHPSPSDIISSMRSPIYASLFQNSPEDREEPQCDNNQQNQHPKPGREDDTQFFLQVNYKGDMQLGVSATLLLNYPSPSFVSLPMKLRVTGFEIRSMAVLTYISKCIHFSFVCDIDEQGDAITQVGDRVDIIRDVKIESEIGDQEGNGPVLRNVGKVEKFLLERLRALARDELAWPGWITFEF